jgi:transcriptional regulator with XRE-family HTH domain
VTEYSPTIKRRQLSKMLLEFRKAKSLTGAQVSARLKWTPSKLTRLELGQWLRMDPRDLNELLDVYEVTDPATRSALLALAKEGRQRGWWVEYGDIFRSLPDFENGASVIRTYEGMLVPGLLQTADYARALFRAGGDLDEPAIDRHVEGRLARQEVLSRTRPPHLWAVIDEGALLRQVGGPEVMAEQIAHIIKLAEQANIAIQVLPLAAGAHPAMTGGFAILDFGGEQDASIVSLETATDSLYLEKPHELQRYTVIYSHVQALALSPEQSVRAMQSMISTVR